MADIAPCCTGGVRHDRRCRGIAKWNVTEVERTMRLKEARISVGLGRRKASQCAGMGIAQLYRYEAGLARPGIEVAMRIRRGLGLEDPWQVEEFRHALDKAAAAGLVARPSENGVDNRKQS